MENSLVLFIGLFTLSVGLISEKQAPGMTETKVISWRVNKENFNLNQCGVPKPQLYYIGIHVAYAFWDLICFNPSPLQAKTMKQSIIGINICSHLQLSLIGAPRPTDAAKEMDNA